MLYKPQVRSRHPSHKELKKDNVLKYIPKKSVIRFGSFKEYKDSETNGGKRIEINTVEAINNSADKLFMKKAFNQKGIKTAPWWTFREGLFYPQDTGEPIAVEDLNSEFPLVTKHRKGSRGVGNIKHDRLSELNAWLDKKIALNATSNYIIEKYLPYLREYRLHVTADGCFYTCRKMIKKDTPKNKRWFRNDNNSVWILETNSMFDKPVNWDRIVEESVSALKATGLDIGAVDVKVQSATTKKGDVREDPNFFCIEINSAPSFGNVTEEKYIKAINKLLTEKSNG